MVHFANDLRTGEKVVLKSVAGGTDLPGSSSKPRLSAKLWHQARELDATGVLSASGALKLPASKHISMPAQCFRLDHSSHTTSTTNATVLLYAEQLKPFVWMMNRTSREWCD